MGPVSAASHPTTADKLIAEIVQRLREIDANDESWSGSYSRAASRVESEFIGRYPDLCLVPSGRHQRSVDVSRWQEGHCTHEQTRFPVRPVPDAWYACPDCGQKVARRGGRIITVAENNARIEAKRHHDEWAIRHADRMYQALDVLCEALSRVEVRGQSGDVEDYDDALADALHLLATQGGEDG